MKVLLARMEAVFRRTRSPTDLPTRVALGGVQTDLETHEATVDGSPVKLTLPASPEHDALYRAMLRAGPAADAAPDAGDN